ncbi:hypothetical protein TCAL_15945 [Tigriopus californicus]|uniref:Uncharacterized protein n=1 Tax=Tigriopus californicus TaxID=6832 RepID=A0A553PFG1_TIGCA|nr:hypothetical protein TCAL_15945 [Tigriopus californicus]
MNWLDTSGRIRVKRTLAAQYAGRSLCAQIISANTPSAIPISTQMSYANDGLRPRAPVSPTCCWPMA